MSNELTVINPGELYRQASDVAGVCRDIVLKKAVAIQGRRYVPVEPWMAIATAHGCVASSKNVERIEGTPEMVGGFRAIGEIRRISDGALISTAEGFVGEDEPTWFGGEIETWDSQARKRVKKTLPKRADFAIRSMCQTRAISRACRSAFAHVVVLIDENLSTTPLEEIQDTEHVDHGEHREPTTAANTAEPGDWKGVICTYGAPIKGKTLGELTDSNIKWLASKFLAKDAPEPKPEHAAMVEGLKLWNKLENTEKKW